jgi:hypothetical protein
MCVPTVLLEQLQYCKGFSLMTTVQLLKDFQFMIYYKSFLSQQILSLISLFAIITKINQSQRDYYCIMASLVILDSVLLNMKFQ